LKLLSKIKIILSEFQSFSLKNTHLGRNFIILALKQDGYKFFIDYGWEEKVSCVY